MSENEKEQECCFCGRGPDPDRNTDAWRKGYVAGKHSGTVHGIHKGVREGYDRGYEHAGGDAGSKIQFGNYTTFLGAERPGDAELATSSNLLMSSVWDAAGCPSYFSAKEVLVGPIWQELEGGERVQVWYHGWVLAVPG